MLEYVLIGIIAVQQVLHYFERKELCNRITGNVQHKQNKKTPPAITAHRKRIDAWRGKEGGSK